MNRNAFLRLALSVASAARCLGALASNNYVNGEVMVKYGLAPLAKIAVPYMLNAKQESFDKDTSWALLKLPAGESVSTAMVQLRKTPGVIACEPNYYRSAQFFPNDPDYPSQWYAQQIDLPNAWNFTLGAPNVTIAIVDSGVDLSHPEFSSRLIVYPGSNLVSNNNNPSDDNGHGTFCAGIAAAGTNNGIGIAGVCGNALIMPVKVLDSTGSGTVATSELGYTFAADHGANIISASFGGPSFSQSEQDAVEYAINKGVMFVAAAGNDGLVEQFYPADYPNVISVGASNSSDGKTSYSNYGEANVTLAAPGSNIYSTLPSDSYGYESGTSMSTPMVSGTLALLKSYAAPNVSSNTLESILFNSCDAVQPYQGAQWVKYGRLNVYNALSNLGASTQSTTVVPSSSAVYEGTLVSGTLGSLSSIDQNFYTVLSQSDGKGDEVASITAQYPITQTFASLKQITSLVSAQAQTGGTVTAYAFDYLKRRWEQVDVSQLQAQSTSAVTGQVSTVFGRYVRGGFLTILVRAVAPGSVPFNFQIDEATLSVTNKS